MSWLQGSFNTHLIALSCIVFVVAAAFVVFDLDDKLYPNQTDGYVGTVNYSEAPKQTLVAEPAPESDASSVQEQVQVMEPKPASKQIAPRTQSEPKSRLPELENKEFSLDLKGDAHLGMSGITKTASLTLKLLPVKGTLLKEFKISDARLLLDDSGISVIGTSASIEGKKITLEFLSESAGKFTIDATLDESLLDDTNNKESVTLDDQNFYLAKKETPYRLQMSGSLSS